MNVFPRQRRRGGEYEGQIRNPEGRPLFRGLPKPFPGKTLNCPLSPFPQYFPSTIPPYVIHCIQYTFAGVFIRWASSGAATSLPGLIGRTGTIRSFSSA